ncbi:hypothetical protein MBLNU457_6824t1 [Dothideomycetes sp. NU457]
MRVAILQFAPQLHSLESNIDKADSLIADLAPSSVDLLVLSELAFTGYNYPSLDSITPYLEPTTSGRSTQWAIDTARRLRCHVTVGYPERTTDTPSKNYNSTVTVSPTGELVANYRKSFLYYTDETWASEGDDGFFFGRLGALGDVAMGICMDINPYKFEAPWGKCEFATHCVTKGARTVVLSMAWLTRLTPGELTGAGQSEKPDLDTVMYWLQRFQPLFQAEREVGEDVVVVLANRCGSEPGKVAGVSQGVDETGEEVVSYAGSSCVIRVRHGEVQIYDMLGRAEEKVLMVDTDATPRYMLTQRTADED